MDNLDFMPCLGIISVYHPSGIFDIASTNQLGAYEAEGWKRVTSFDDAKVDVARYRGEEPNGEA